MIFLRKRFIRDALSETLHLRRFIWDASSATPFLEHREVNIKHIETFAVSLPMVKPLKMAFEEVKSAANVLVRLETDGGVTGWGGAAAAPTMTGETVQSMTPAIRHLAPKLEGMALEDHVIPSVERIVREIREKID